MQQAVTTDIVKFTTELQLLLEPRIVQVDTPQRIPANDLQPFLTGRKKIRCVFPDRWVVSSTLFSIQVDHLLASIGQKETFRILRRRGEPVIAMFSGHQNYVLQTTLGQIYAGQMELQYNDPRYDKRFMVTRETFATIQGLSAQVVTELNQGNLEIVRTTSWEVEDSETRHITQLQDGFRSKETEEMGMIADYVTTDPPLTVLLTNISHGGAGLSAEGVFPKEQWEKKLITFNVQLARDRRPEREKYHRIAVLACVRIVRHTSTQSFFHLRFLQRLPDDFSLAHLELGDESSSKLSSAV
jgi:hypothetical protein